MKPRTFLVRLTLTVALACSAAACGGSVAEHDDGGANDNTASGGGTNPGPDGGANGVTGSGGCCLAPATCNPADTPLDWAAECPIGASCYTNEACCGAIKCMEAQAPCEAAPSCLEGETEVPTCGAYGLCIKRALCGKLIECEVDTSTCPVEASIHVVSYGDSVEECAAFNGNCHDGATPYSNECGCGCIQPETCPEFLDCERVGSSQVCDRGDECPYSSPPH